MHWLRRLFNRKQLETDLDRELKDHLERQISDLRRSGLPDDEARRTAIITLGGVEQVREECRDARGTVWVESALADLRLALRILSKSPGFTLVAILTLALGVGANTAIFALLDAVRLRSLPVPDPRKLALIQVEGGNGFGVMRLSTSLSYKVFEQIHERQRGFSGVFAWTPSMFEIGKGANMHQVNGYWVSGGMFSTLGLTPAAGRLFSDREDRPGCGISGAIISYSFWQSEFGARDSAIGSKLLILGHPTEIVGVTAANFAGPEIGNTFALAVPLCSMPSYTSDDEVFRRSDVSFLTVMGRLRPGWSLAQAKDQLASISPAIFEATSAAGYEAVTHKDYLNSRLAAYPAANGVSGLRETYDVSLWLLLGITGFVLLIACTNLANLMLVRARTREREIAVRLALGASRPRLIRQLITESLVLAAVGAVLGAWLARVLSRSIVTFLTTQRDSIYLDLSFNWHILAFTAGVGLLTCLLFGLVPAFRGSSADPGEAMKVGGRSVTGDRTRSWFQNVLVVSQVSLSLVLVIAAVLFARSFWNLTTLNPGFRTKDVVIASLDFSHLAPLPEKAASVYLRNVLEQLRTLPEVESAGTSTHVPLDGSSWTLGFDLSSMRGSSKFTWVSPGYFEAMGKRVLAGRSITDGDSVSGPNVAVVNRTFVRRYLNGVNPIGRTLRSIAEPNYPATKYEIAGVVEDAKYADLREEIPPEVFAAAQQRDVSAFQNVFVRSSAPPNSVISEVKHKLNEISPGIRSDFRVIEAEVRDGLVRERLMAVLSGFFGGLAALLAAVGLYGVISYIVLARRNEIGVRLALGATRRSVVGAIFGRLAPMLLCGAALGVLLALTTLSLARSLLFGLKTNDLLTFVGATVFLLAIAALASFIPARRASRLDPLVALRYE